MKHKTETTGGWTISVTTKATSTVHDIKRTRAAEQAFERLFIEHWPRVYAVLVRLVDDRDEAQDLAIETFWRLYTRPFSAPASNLGGWLYRVATNLGLNTLRARKRRMRYELEAGQDALTSQEAEDPVDALSTGETRERVRRVLAGMDERQAQLLLLRHSGLDYAELAAALGVSPNSIGTLLVRAEREFEKRYKALDGTGSNEPGDLST
ncbi:MAG: sigma-70 family RNA polymerase sigma factor [Anaerolineae bacterium]